MAHVRYLFNKEHDKAAKNQIADAEIGTYALVKNTFTAQNHETAQTLTIYFRRPVDAKARDQGYSPLATSRYAYHATKGWITPTDQNLEEYVAKKEIIPYTTNALIYLVNVQLPAQNLKTILDPTPYMKLSNKFLNVLRHKSEYTTTKNEAAIYQLVIAIGPLTSTIKKSMFGRENPQHLAAKAIKQVFQLLNKCNHANKKDLNEVIDKIINVTFSEILKLPGNNHFAKEMEEILKKEYPEQSKKFLERLESPKTESTTRSPGKSQEHKG